MGEEDEEAAIAAAAAAEAAVKLPQSEAIMEAIIRSSKPLSIGEDNSFQFSKSLDRFVQQISDRLVPWLRCRWILFTLLLAGFTSRVVLIEAHFFAAYVLAIYILNQVLL